MLADTGLKKNCDSECGEEPWFEKNPIFCCWKTMRVYKKPCVFVLGGTKLFTQHLAFSMSELLPIDSWAKFAAIGLFVVISKSGTSQSHQILLTESWAKFAAIDLFAVIVKSGNSQSQQIFPTDCWAKFAAIDLFVAISKSGNSQSQQIFPTDS